METYGNLWKSMEIYGNLWKPMEIYGNLWKSMEVYGNLMPFSTGKPMGHADVFEVGSLRFRVQKADTRLCMRPEARHQDLRGRGVASGFGSFHRGQTYEKNWLVVQT